MEVLVGEPSRGFKWEKETVNSRTSKSMAFPNRLDY